MKTHVSNSIFYSHCCTLLGDSVTLGLKKEGLESSWPDFMSHSCHFKAVRPFTVCLISISLNGLFCKMKIVSPNRICISTKQGKVLKWLAQILQHSRCSVYGICYYYFCCSGQMILFRVEPSWESHLLGDCGTEQCDSEHWL